MIKLYMLATSASHLDAMQGASEERPEAYLEYDEDVPQLSNAAVRQESAGVSTFGGQQGRTVRGAG